MLTKKQWENKFGKGRELNWTHDNDTEGIVRVVFSKWVTLVDTCRGDFEDTDGTVWNAFLDGDGKDEWSDEYWKVINETEKPSYNELLKENTELKKKLGILK